MLCLFFERAQKIQGIRTTRHALSDWKSRGQASSDYDNKEAALVRHSRGAEDEIP